VLAHDHRGRIHQLVSVRPQNLRHTGGSHPGLAYDQSVTETAFPRPFRPQSRWVRSVGLMIFFSRWLQAPLYIGLIIAQIIYVIVFMVELINLGGDCARRRRRNPR
jgi:hypothetical protein